MTMGGEDLAVYRNGDEKQWGRSEERKVKGGKFL